MSYEAFGVVVVPFPFIDRPIVKRRQALVVSNAAFNADHAALILAMISTARRSDWPSDIEIADRAAAGLSPVCRVRLKLFTLDPAIVLRRLGRLSDRDRAAVATALNRCLARS